jgi:hypothetical protein
MKCKKAKEVELARMWCGNNYSFLTNERSIPVNEKSNQNNGSQAAAVAAPEVTAFLGMTTPGVTAGTCILGVLSVPGAIGDGKRCVISSSSVPLSESYILGARLPVGVGPSTAIFIVVGAMDAPAMLSRAVAKDAVLSIDMRRDVGSSESSNAVVNDAALSAESARIGGRRGAGDGMRKEVEAGVEMAGGLSVIVGTVTAVAVDVSSTKVLVDAAAVARSCRSVSDGTDAKLESSATSEELFGCGEVESALGRPST